MNSETKEWKGWGNCKKCGSQFERGAFGLSCPSCDGPRRTYDEAMREPNRCCDNGLFTEPRDCQKQQKPRDPLQGGFELGCIAQAQQDHLVISKTMQDYEHLLRDYLIAVEGLRKIANPIPHMRREAEAEGAKLDGAAAVSLAHNSAYLKDIASKTLTALGVPSIEVSHERS